MQEIVIKPPMLVIPASIVTNGDMLRARSASQNFRMTRFVDGLKP
jgi:hypothetical protein